MSEANRSLQEFVTFLMSPDMYGSMSLAASMMKWAVHLVVTILMIAAVIGILFVVLKFAVDVVFLSGVGNLIDDGNEGMGKFKGKMQKFSCKNAIDGEIGKYIKEDSWKPILTLAFIGLLASGMALPLAGQVAGAAGAAIDKLIGLDPAGKIAEFDAGDFTDSMEFTRDKDLKIQYDKAMSEALTYRDYIYDLAMKNPGEDNATLQRYRNLYTHSMIRAEMLAQNLNAKVEELRVPEGYFAQHKEGCKTAFIVDEVVSQPDIPVTLSCGD